MTIRKDLLDELIATRRRELDWPKRAGEEPMFWMSVPMNLKHRGMKDAFRSAPMA